MTNAKNISFTRLIIEPNIYLNQNDYYLIVCEYGIKSKEVSKILNKKGFKTYSLKGGMASINNS